MDKNWPQVKSQHIVIAAYFARPEDILDLAHGLRIDLQGTVRRAVVMTLGMLRLWL